MIHRLPIPKAVVWLALLVLLMTSAHATDATSPDTPVEPRSSTEELMEELARLRTLVEQLSADRRREVEELEKRIASLEEQLRREQQERATEELEELRKQAEKESAEQAEKEAEAEEQREVFVGRQRNLQAMNPEISFLGDLSYGWTDVDVRDGFLVRGIEIALQAPLDPHSRFKGALAAHQEPPELHHHDDALPQGGHEHAEEIQVNVEEAYMEWVALPLNTRLRVGKFRQQFGTLNRWHPHALQSVDTPFALRNAFGHDGLVGLGVGADWQLPRLWASSNSLTIEIVNADNPSAFAGSDFHDPTILLRHTGFFDLGPDTYFEVGLNGVTGPNDEEGDLDTTLGSFEFNFVWEPVQRAKYRSFEVRGELMRTRFETESDGIFHSTSLYTYATWRLGRQWIVGLRYDNAELPWPRIELHDGQLFTEGLRERAWSPMLTFWQSEFVRLRLQYQHASRDVAWAHGAEDDDRLWIQITFAAGPHKHEAY